MGLCAQLALLALASVFALLTLLVQIVSGQGVPSLFSAPGMPAGSVAGDIQKRNAIDRANRDAKLATRAFGFDDRVHGLVAAHNGIGWTRLKA